MGHPKSYGIERRNQKPTSKAADKSVRSTRSNSVRALPDQGEKLLAGFLFVAEAAQHGGRYGGGVLLLDATHHHAQVAGFDDDRYALRLDYSLDGFGDLRGETLLNLEAAGEEFDQARDFAEADYFAVGNVGDMDFSEERQQVVLTEAEHFDVFDDDHFIVGDGEERAFEQGLGIFGVAAGEELQRLTNALGREFETFAVRVFAQTDEHFLDEIFDA